MHACHTYMMVVGMSKWRSDECKTYMQDGRRYNHVEIISMHAFHT